MDIGRIGIWTFALDQQPATRTRELAAELDELGFGCLWIPEAVGREPFASAAILLGATKRMVVATGIASLHARSPVTMAAGHKTLVEAYPDRFFLGVGVSHAPMVERVHAKAYDKPYTTMVTYLDAMDAAPFAAAPPTTEPERVLAALGPRMLALSATRARGAHPYFVPVEHTAVARRALDEASTGTRALLAPEQAVVLETDPTEARRIARAHMAVYLGLPNYTNNLRRLGFGDDDLADGGSDRLVDAIVAWGDLDAVAGRIRAHHEAGADHVAIQALPKIEGEPPIDQWRELAALLV